MDCLQEELPSQQFNTWIRPLRAETAGASIQLLAPNRFVKEWVHDKFLERISELINEIEPQAGYDVVVDIGGTAVSRGSTLPTQVTSEPKSQAECLSKQLREIDYEENIVSTLFNRPQHHILNVVTE